MDDWFYPALRFAHYALLLGLFGLTAFRVIGLKWLDRGAAPPIERAAVAAALTAPFVSLVQMLASIAAMMGQGIAGLEWMTVAALLSDTSLGWAFLARLTLLIVAAAVLLLGKGSPPALRSATMPYALALATLAWSGHAAATEGAAGTFHRLSDAAHLIAAGLWIGAVIWFLFLTKKAHRPEGHGLAAPLLLAMHRFAGLGLLLVAIMIFTGAANAQLIFGLANSGAVLQTNYGRLMAAKLALVGVMLLFAARNALIGRRYAKAVGALGTETGPTLAALRKSLSAELAVGISIIAIVALMTIMSPMGD